jgi:dipicolinate synthase subunit B
LELAGKKIGFAFTGSFCNFESAIETLEDFVHAGVDVTPIFSYHTSELKTRFISGEELFSKVIEITGKQPITSIVEAEPIGPKSLLDAVIIIPATGNTIAKLANGITDTPVLMAAKCSLRNDKPVILAIATNDGLGNTAKNLGLLLNTKNIYIVPFGQDGYDSKHNSLLSKLSLSIAAVENALDGKQLQPVLLGVNELIS